MLWFIVSIFICTSIANLTINTFRGWGKSNLINIIQGPLVDSFLVSLIGCLGIVVAALVVSYASRLFPPFHENFIKLCMLGMLFRVRSLPFLSYLFSGMGKYLGFTTLTSFMFTLTPAGLIIAYFVRFMTPALAPIEAGMTRII